MPDTKNTKLAQPPTYRTLALALVLTVRIQKQEEDQIKLKRTDFLKATRPRQ